MTLIDFDRRLARIESARREGAPTRVLSDRPPSVGPEIHVGDWRAWIADSLGAVVNGVLYVTSPQPTVEEWMARHVTGH